MVEDRTRMLAAIGHDLRTPITRLRLKAEFISDEATRVPILRDLEQMNAMVHGALSYLREGRAGRKPEPADVATLVRTVCDEFADIGHDVQYSGPDHLIAPVYTGGLQRAVYDAPRSGKPPEFTVKQRQQVIALACTDPPEGCARWTLELLCEHAVKHGFVESGQQERSLAVAAGTRPQAVAKKMWCVPKLDAEFRERMEDILTLYERPYDPAEPVICLDEQPQQLLADTRPSEPCAPG